MLKGKKATFKIIGQITKVEIKIQLPALLIIDIYLRFYWYVFDIFKDDFCVKLIMLAWHYYK